MNLSKFQKIMVAGISAWPIVYMFIFFFFIFSQVFSVASGTQQQEPSFESFQILFALHFLTMIVIFALISFYIYFIFKSDKVPKDKKTLWAVVIFFGSMISMPIFWFLYIWPTPENGHSNQEMKADEK